MASKLACFFLCLTTSDPLHYSTDLDESSGYQETREDVVYTKFSSQQNSGLILHPLKGFCLHGGNSDVTFSVNLPKAVS